MDNQAIAVRFLFLGLVIKNLELDIEHVKKAPFKIKEPYLAGLERAHAKATEEIKHLKKIMYNKQIKIMATTRNKNFSHYIFHNGNQKEELSYYNYMIRKNVKEIMEELIYHTPTKEYSKRL